MGAKQTAGGWVTAGRAAQAARSLARHWLPGCAATFLYATTAAAQTAPTYADLAPLFAQKCVLCHFGDSPPAGLRLDSLDALLKGSAKGPIVRAGEPAASELLRRVKGTSLPRMPMTGPPFLAENEIALIERWIAGGLQQGSPAAAPTAPQPRRAAGAKLTYLDVAPIFARRCAKCHTDAGQMGPPPEGFRLTSWAATLATNDRARVVPGAPAASELVRRIRGQALPRMPFDGPPYLDDEEIRLIETWIAQGAHDASGLAAPPATGASLRLHGKLDGGGRLDGLDIVIDRASRIDKNPREGSYVELRGRVGERGEVIVDRLRRR